jgi:hypothetical protein
MNKAKMKFTIEVNMKGALMTKRYENLLQRVLTQKSPLTFYQVISLIPSIRFHKFNIQSSEVNRNGSDEELGKVTAVVNLKNVD